MPLGGGGGDLVSTLPDVCQQVKMSDMILLKMGVKFATSLNMGGTLPQKLYIITCRNVLSCQTSHRIHWMNSKQRDIE